jgi:nucleoid-associated protein YgaU
MFGSGLDFEHPFGTIRVMSRTRVRRRRTTLVAAVAVVGGLWAGPIAHASGSDARPVASHRYVVRAGDTVWEIAERLSDGSDPRPLSDVIASANDLDAGSIRVGQTLLIPTG